MAMISKSKIARAKYIAFPEGKAKLAITEGQSFWETMDEFEQVSLRNYTDRDICFEINNHLYNGVPASKDIVDTIELIDQALKRASLPEDMVLYRGVSHVIWALMMFDPKYTTPGKVFPAEGFLSTTYDRATALKYASENADDADEIAAIEIWAAKGMQALSLEAHSYSPKDHEILINRHTKFKVIEARKDGNLMRLIWEVVL